MYYHLFRNFIYKCATFILFWG